MRITDFKHCSKCKTHKHRDLFSKCSHARDGRNSWCKQCLKAYRIAKKTSVEVCEFQTGGSTSQTIASSETTTPSAESAGGTSCGI